jgi:hypothetical protein
MRVPSTTPACPDYPPRNTVRKVVRSGTTQFRADRESQPRPKLRERTAQLDELLAGNVGKPAREQLTLIRSSRSCGAWGYPGGYDAVRRYARQWQTAQGQATATPSPSPSRPVAQA